MIRTTETNQRSNTRRPPDHTGASGVSRFGRLYISLSIHAQTLRCLPLSAELAAHFPHHVHQIPSQG